MKIAPLIHSRTGERDYDSKFSVRPKNFSPAEISWARSKILPATVGIDRFNGIRRLVAAKDGICIAGVVCTMKYFVNKCLNGVEAAKPYVDVKGRLYGVFLGFAFKTSGNKIPVVTDADLWQWFEKYFVEKWNQKSAWNFEVDYSDWSNVSPARADKTPPTGTYSDVQLYDAAEFDDENLFETYLALALKKNLAFCSNVDKKPIEDKVYTAVTTSANNIAALKKNAPAQRLQPVQPKKKMSNSAPQKQTETTTTAPPSKPTLNRKSTPTSGKFLWPAL